MTAHPAGPAGRSAVWAAAALAAAAGGLTCLDPYYGLALVAGVLVVAVVAADARLLPLLLIATLFFESVGLHPGLRSGRVAGLLALAVVLYRVLVRGTDGLRTSAVLFVALAYGAWLLLSTYWASDAGAVYHEVFEYALAAAYMFAFALLVRSRWQVLALFRVLMLGALVFGIVAFVEYVLHKAHYTATGLGPSGLQGDHNLFAIYQVVALPPTLVVAAVETRRWLRLIALATVPVIALSVAASLSRTGLIVLAATLAVTLFAQRSWFFRRPRDKLLYLGAFGVAALAVVAAGSSAFVERVKLLFSEAGPTSDRASGRIDFWRAAWHGYRESNPLLGLGAGNFKPASVGLLQTTPGVNAALPSAMHPRVVHNVYLETLTELGLPGLLLLVLLLLLTARSLLVSLRRARAQRDSVTARIAAALLVALFAIAVSGLSLSDQLGKPLWIVIGLALALEVTTRARGRPRARPSPS